MYRNKLSLNYGILITLIFRGCTKNFGNFYVSFDVAAKIRKASSSAQYGKKVD